MKWTDRIKVSNSISSFKNNLFKQTRLCNYRTIMTLSPKDVDFGERQLEKCDFLQGVCRVNYRTSISPVVFFCVLQSRLFELLVHLSVEVVSEEERPESEERVHLLRLANPQPFPLCEKERIRSVTTLSTNAMQSLKWINAPFRHRRRNLWYPCWVKPLSLSSSWEGCQNLGRDWGVQP